MNLKPSNSKKILIAVLATIIVVACVIVFYPKPKYQNIFDESTKIIELNQTIERQSTIFIEYVEDLSKESEADLTAANTKIDVFKRLSNTTEIFHMYSLSHKENQKAKKALDAIANTTEVLNSCVTDFESWTKKTVETGFSQDAAKGYVERFCNEIDEIIFSLNDCNTKINEAFQMVSNQSEIILSTVSAKVVLQSLNVQAMFGSDETNNFEQIEKDFCNQTVFSIDGIKNWNLFANFENATKFATAINTLKIENVFAAIASDEKEKFEKTLKEEDAELFNYFCQNLFNLETLLGGKK